MEGSYRVYRQLISQLQHSTVNIPVIPYLYASSLQPSLVRVLRLT